MTSLPNPDEVAGPYLTQYEVYYKRLDPDGKNEIAAVDAANFLKKSTLSDDILGKIWDLSDPDGKGTLDRKGLFVACKLVALVQDHQDLNVCNLLNECPAPNFGDATAPGAPTAKAAPVGSKKDAGGIHFLVKPDEKRKYDALFDQLQPVDAKLPGDKVRQVMMGSKLPMPTLGQIWDISDVDRDGMLDRYEFTVAMHLVFRCLQGDQVPSVLPKELHPAKIPQPLSPIPNLNGGIPKPAQTVEAVPWVVNAGEKLRYTALFKQTDTDRDGFVSGVEIKNVFLQTGLPQNILAHIWNLCDMKQEGKLNPEQFCLAMWLIQRKQSGKDPPAALTPDMVPPSMRPRGQDAGLGSIYNNPELEMIAKEIQAMLSEKLQLEKEVQEVEYQISLKNTESHSLQSEFDTLSATLRQLTSQRDMAQKRLDDLDTQIVALLNEEKTVIARIEVEKEEIEKLRKQSDEQEETLVQKEEEVHGKKRAYERLKEEERELLAEIRNTELEIQRLEEDLKLADELEEEAKEKLDILQEAEKHMIEGNKMFDNANEDCSNVPDNFLEPLRLNMELPDYEKLDEKKKKPPPVPASPVMNGRMENTDVPVWAQNDAFSGSAFDEGNKSGGLFSSAFDSRPLGQQGVARFDPFSSTHHQFDPFGFPSTSFASTSKSSSAISPAAFGGVGGDSFDEKPPPLAPRPDSAGGSTDMMPESPTPALPPKNNVPAPRRPPPPKRPPPPGGAGASRGGPAAPPPVPSPPKSQQGQSDDPFGTGDAAVDNSGGGFADSSAFDDQSTGETESAFAFPSSRQEATTTASTASQLWTNYNSDSAFSSAGPTPTHQQNKLEFNEDPFKNANYRYGDPFELTKDEDLFGGKEDPFTASVFGAFGSTAPPETSAVTSAMNLSVGSDSGDPFSLTLKNSLQPSAPPAPPAITVTSRKDPFGLDPFAQLSLTSPTRDPFVKPASASKDDWFVQQPSSSISSKYIPKVDGVPRNQVPKASKAATKSLATNWGRDDQHLAFGGTSGGTRVPSNVDPFSLPKSTMMNSSKSATKEKKKNKWVSKLQPKSSGNSSSSSSKHLQPQQHPRSSGREDFQLKLASEASRRAEEERLRRLQLQEEQDLAYAIALSKAEAASLKTS